MLFRSSAVIPTGARDLLLLPEMFLKLQRRRHARRPAAEDNHMSVARLVPSEVEGRLAWIVVDKNVARHLRPCVNRRLDVGRTGDVPGHVKPGDGRLPLAVEHGEARPHVPDALRPLEPAHRGIVLALAAALLYLRWMALPKVSAPLTLATGRHLVFRPGIAAQVFS